jgi:hypothetical protein
MKKIICALLILLVIIGAFCACGNRQFMDTTYSFEYAYVALPNGECVEGRLSSWKDWDNSDTIQVVINGKTYLTHYSNVVLISE